MKEKINICFVSIIWTCVFCCASCIEKSAHQFNINIRVANALELNSGKPLPKTLQQIANYIELDEQTVCFPVITISRLDTAVAEQPLDVPLNSLNDFRKSINLLSPLNLMSDFNENISKIVVPEILSLETRKQFDSLDLANDNPEAIWINIHDTSTLFLETISNLLKKNNDNIEIILYYSPPPKKHLPPNPPTVIRKSRTTKTPQKSSSNFTDLASPCEFDIITFDLNGGEISCITNSKSDNLKYVLYIATDRLFNNSNTVLALTLNNNRFGKTLNDQIKLKSIQQYANLYAKMYVTCGGEGKYTNVIGPLSNSCISSGDCILMYRKLN